MGHVGDMYTNYSPVDHVTGLLTLFLQVNMIEYDWKERHSTQH